MRSVLYLRHQHRVASLAIDGSVQFWDPHLSFVNTVGLYDPSTLLCDITLICKRGTAQVNVQTYSILHTLHGTSTVRRSWSDLSALYESKQWTEYTSGMLNLVKSLFSVMLKYQACGECSGPMKSLIQVATRYDREVVCMAASESSVAVGSQNHISLVDHRVKDPVSSFANVDLNHGEQLQFLDISLAVPREALLE